MSEPKGRENSVRFQRAKETMSSNGHPVIKLDGVTKVFFTDEVETHALSGVHLEIRNGEYVSIAGPSGCGKSTLLSHPRACWTPRARAATGSTESRPRR